MLVNSRNRLIAANDSLFEEWTQLSAYLYGVLYSDGYLSPPPRNHFCISLSEKDLQWLTMLRGYFAPEARIRSHVLNDQWARRTAVRFSFSSRQLAMRCRQYGLKICPPILPDACVSHFIRGVFDGDGGPYVDQQSGRVRLSIIGDRTLIPWIIQQAERLAGVSNKAGPYEVSNSAMVQRLRWCGKSVPLVREWLYRDACVYLERKRVLCFKES